MGRRLLPLVALLIPLLTGFIPLMVLFLSGWHIPSGAIPGRNGLILLGKSLLISTSVSLLSGAIGMSAGLILARTNLPARRVTAGLLAIPLLVPPYVNAIAWFNTLQKAGLSGILSGFPGVVFVLTFSLFPIPMFLTMAHSRAIESRMEESALMYAPWPVVIRKITLPMMKPSILMGTSVVFILSMGEIGAPTFLRYSVYPVEILSRFSAFYDLQGAAASSIPLILISLLLLIWSGKGTYIPLSMKGNPLSIPVEGLIRKLLIVLMASSAAFVLIPYLTLLSSIDFQSLDRALQMAGGSLIKSIMLAGAGASLITASGFLMGYTMARRLPAGRWIQAMAFMLFALPGAVMGVGLIGLWNRPSTGWIYTSPIIILLGYVARYSILGAGTAASGIALVPPSLEEAAILHGAGILRIFTKILAPLTGNMLIAGWFLSFIFCLRDFDTTFLVQPAGWETLPVLLFTYMANGDPGTVAALTVIIIITSLMAAAMGLMAVRFLKWRI